MHVCYFSSVGSMQLLEGILWRWQKMHIHQPVFTSKYHFKESSLVITITLWALVCIQD